MIIMKTLLVAFLLAIVSLQAAFAAAGDFATATTKLEQTYARTVTDLPEEVAVDTDTLKTSAAIEELSDYVIAFLSIPRVITIPTPSDPTALAFASIHLPGTEPPPRG